MIDFPTLKRQCMDAYWDKVVPFLSDGRTGHLWTGRLELAWIIEVISDWMNDNGADVEAVLLRNEFLAMPAGQYTREQCCNALMAETARWRAR